MSAEGPANIDNYTTVVVFVQAPGKVWGFLFCKFREAAVDKNKLLAHLQGELDSYNRAIEQRQKPISNQLAAAKATGEVAAYTVAGYFLEDLIARIKEGSK